MTQTPFELRLQAAFLILVSCSILTGLVSLTVRFMPFMAVPERLLLPPEGAPAVMLGSFAVMALTFRAPVWRFLAGALLSIYGGYGLVRWGLSVHPGTWTLSSTDPLALVPLASLAVIMVAVASFLGVRSFRGALFGFATGCVGVVVGALILISQVQEGLDADADGFVADFSVMVGLYFLCFGAVLIVVCERKPHMRFLARPEEVAVGLLGVTGTFMLFLLANWTTHIERHQKAQAILQHHAENLVHELHTHVNLIERLGRRWAALDYEVPSALRRTEVEQYFADIPALEALMVVRESGRSRWTSTRAARHLSWLTDQTAKSEVLSWMRQAREQDTFVSWRFPDSENPLKALVLITTARSQGQLVAALDTQALPSLGAPHDNHEFDIVMLPKGDTDRVSDEYRRIGLPEVWEVVTVELDKGLNVALGAKGGPPQPLSLQGALPVAILVFGLWMSYLLLMGRSYLGAYKTRTRELEAAEQEFRSLFLQSADAVFAIDTRGYYRALNSGARQIAGLAESDVNAKHYRSVVRAGMSEDDQHLFDTAFSNAAAGHSQSLEVRFVFAGVSEPRNYDCDLLPIVVDGRVTGVFVIAKDITEKRKHVPGPEAPGEWVAERAYGG